MCWSGFCCTNSHTSFLTGLVWVSGVACVLWGSYGTAHNLLKGAILGWPPVLPLLCVPLLLCRAATQYCVYELHRITKLIRLPPGGRDESLMTLAPANKRTHTQTACAPPPPTHTPSRTHTQRHENAGAMVMEKWHIVLALFRCAQMFTPKGLGH